MIAPADPPTLGAPANPPAPRALWLVSAGVLGLWALHNALLLPWETEHLDPTLGQPALIALGALVWLLPIHWYLSRHDPRPKLIALGVTTPIHRRGLAWSAAGSLVYLCLVTLLLLATVPSGSRPNALATLARLGTLYMLVHCALEELLMRGFLLGQLLRFISPLWAQLLVAVLFMLMHVPGWVAQQGLEVALLPSLLSVLVLGGVLGGISRASNSIVPAIALHFGVNLLPELLGAG